MIGGRWAVANRRVIKCGVWDRRIDAMGWGWILTQLQL